MAGAVSQPFKASGKYRQGADQGGAAGPFYVKFQGAPASRRFYFAEVIFCEVKAAIRVKLACLPPLSPRQRTFGDTLRSTVSSLSSSARFGRRRLAVETSERGKDDAR